jgi:DNA-binding MltR family transcriptional regulator
MFENNQSKMSFEDKISIDNLYRINEDNETSKISLTMSQSMKSMQTSGIARQTSSLMTKTTFNAINKVDYKNRCESYFSS